jgi:hypothetical protein
MKIKFFYATRSRFLTLPTYEVAFRPIMECPEKTERAAIYNEYFCAYLGEYDRSENCDNAVKQYVDIQKNPHFLPIDWSTDVWIFRIKSLEHVEIGTFNSDQLEDFEVFTLEEVIVTIKAWSEFLKMPCLETSRMEITLPN